MEELKEVAKKVVSADDRTAEIAAAFVAGVKFAELGSENKKEEA